MKMPLPSYFLYAALLLAPACRHSTAPAATTAPADDCIDPSKVHPDRMCTMQYDPVCGCNGQTYGNACTASNAGVRTFAKGPCPEAKPK